MRTARTPMSIRVLLNVCWIVNAATKIARRALSAIVRMTNLCTIITTAVRHAIIDTSHHTPA